MKPRNLLILLVLIVGISPLRAQDAIPWPPDPSEIFAEGVEIIDTEIIVTPPSPKLDDETRTIQIYDDAENEWKTYPYPDEVEYFWGIDRYGDDAYLLSTTWHEYGWSRIPKPDGQWLLDINTGEFSRPELVCGEIPPVSGEGKWVIYRPSQEEVAYLCNTGSGLSYGPLPQAQYENWDMDVSVAVSPDGSQAILFTSWQVYAYSLISGDFIELGNAPSPPINDYVNVEWMGNRLVLMRASSTTDMMFPWVDYYLGDPSQPGSLEHFKTVLRGYPLTTLDNPPRYQWVSAEDGVCYLIQVNQETGQLDKYDLGDLCSEGEILGDGSGDYLFHDIQWRWVDIPELGEQRGFPESAILARMNPATGERTDLLEGEIEWVMSISPEGDYATLILDGSGDIDMVPYLMQRLGCIPGRDDNPPGSDCKQGQPSLAIVDLMTGAIRYQITTSWVWLIGSTYPWFHYYTYWADCGCLSKTHITLDDIDYEGLHVYPPDDLLGLGDNLFLLIEREIDDVSEDENEAYQATIIDLSGEEAVEIPLGVMDIARIMPESRQILYWVDGKTVEGYNVVQASTALNLYDITTGESRPVVKAVPEERYHLRELSGIKVGRTISLSFQPVTAQSDSMTYVTYTIRLPED